MTSLDHERWMRVKGRLRTEVGEEIFSSWFTRLDLDGIENGSVRMSVPTRFLKSWLQTQYGSRLLSCWQTEDGDVRRIDIRVRSAVRPPAVEKACALAGDAAGSNNAHVADRARGAAIGPIISAHESFGGSPLDQRLTFENFIVGRCNALAHAAARQVAAARRGEPVVFNPFYVHSGVGLGKTHLLQAVTFAGNGGGDRKVLYLTAERFMYGFVSALRAQTAIAFKESLRGIDVLVIDDLQFLQGKSMQAEFSHTLNSLIDAGRQVVVAADRPPADMESLDERVRSRLAGGLVVELGALGEDLRLEIVKARVAAVRQYHGSFDVPPPVLAYIARCVTQNGRDLEGALTRLLAQSKFNGQAVTMELAEREVRDLIRPQEPRRVKIEEIQRIVALHYNVSRSDLLSSRRTANVVRPRQVAMYLAKSLTLRSLPEIGRRFGGRDHTTVLHAVRKIELLLGKDASLAQDVDALRRRLQE
ncbi:MAG: chromosomal replication initiator protein DnaA [Proteobacteria bacterium]|nr:chromosomal replication initiator protein DnaA [Pseudomonadota bacterium]